MSNLTYFDRFGLFWPKTHNLIFFHFEMAFFFRFFLCCENFFVIFVNSSMSGQHQSVVNQNLFILQSHTHTWPIKKNKFPMSIYVWYVFIACWN